MKRFLFILTVILFAGIVQKLSAQDTIYKVDRSSVVAKIIEVGTYDIKYKRYSAPDGPLYVLHKTDIWKIAYSDGSVEYFNRRYEVQTDPKWGQDQRPVCLSLNMFDIALSMVTVSGEFNLGSSNAAIRIPLSFGLRSGQSTANGIDGYYYNSGKLFSTGLGLIYFPSGKFNQTNYYVGFATEYGQTKQRRYNNYPSYGYTYYFDNYGGAGIVNGVQIQVAKEIAIGIDCTIGFQYSSTEFRPMGRMGLLMGWRLGRIGKNASVNL